VQWTIEAGSFPVGRQRSVALRLCSGMPGIQPFRSTVAARRSSRVNPARPGITPDRGVIQGAFLMACIH
jgi:hypothetical protein